MGYLPEKKTVSQFDLKDRFARQYLSFAGKSSKDFLLYLSGPGVYDSPAADVESTSVPGRNGDIISENARAGRRRYQNVDIKYEAFFFNGLPAKTAAVKSWLLSPVGYQKLQDTYDPDFFRMAVCTEAMEFDVTAQKAAKMDLVFNCKPQRWSVEGQRTVRLESRSNLMNPFAFPAQPVFKVYGNSGGVLYVGDASITIHSIKDYAFNAGSLAKSTFAWKNSPAGFFISTDGGKTWGYGWEKDESPVKTALLLENTLQELDERYKKAGELTEELLEQLDERYKTASALSEELIKSLDARYGTADKLSEVLLAQLDERYKTASALSEELIEKLDERYGTADKLSETLLTKLDERYAPPICAQEAAPKNPKTNALWVDTTALRLKLWDGEIWQTVGYEPPEPEPDPDTPTEGGGEEDGKQEGESSGTDSGGTGAGGTGD